MSNREIAIKLLEDMPEHEIEYVISYIQGFQSAMRAKAEETAPDEWDMKMIAEAERENDGSTLTLEEMLKRDGLTYADL